MVQIDLGGLHKQVEDQLNFADVAAALESQSDVVSFTLQSLITDLEASNVTLSDKTKSGLAALQTIAQQSSVTDADINVVDSSLPLQAVIRRKSRVRQLQVLYYKAKQALGIG